MRVVLTLFGLALLAGVVMLVVAFLEDPEPVVEDVVDEDEEPETTDDPEPTPTVEDNGDPRRVPRVLPPDAALEDIRDALAANDDDALQAAYEQLGRLAASRGRVRTALRNEILSMADKDIRAIAIAAVGQSRDDHNERWLVSFLDDRRAAPTDRTSALIALATAQKGVKPGSRMKLATINVDLAPVNDEHADVIRRYLDEPGSTSRSEVLHLRSAEAIALALFDTVRHSAVYAPMIITSDGERRAHLRELNDVLWKSLRGYAVDCVDLDDRTKEKIAAVE